MNIDIKLQDKELQERVQRLVKSGQDLSPATAAIAAHLKAVTEQAFQDERDPSTGEPWAELSEVTLERRKKAGAVSRSSGSAKKLQVKRNLLNSIVADYDAHSAYVGTNLKYATTHQYGAIKGQFGFAAFRTRDGAFEVPWGDIPARPFLGLPDQGPDVDKVTDILRRHFGG